MTNINIQRIKDYMSIFGLEKMLYLWKEYTIEAGKAWQRIDSVDWEQRRMFFHNWRSGSKIFGMDKFALHSQIIEENILKKRYDKALAQISDAKDLYISQVKDVEKYLKIEEQDND